MFEELYAHERSASVGQMLQRPSLPPTEPGTFTGMGSALADALPHAALTAGSAWAAMLDAYGKASAYANAPTVARMHGEPPPDLDPLQRDTLGKMFDSEDARRFRETAKAFAPDPVAVGFAGQLVHGLVSTMGKAVVYSVAGGPAAPVLFGGDLGINRAQELADQGVSGGTAAAAGLVTGLTSAAMLRLPPALGATRLQSAGIGAAINPVMGVVERGTIQQMLQHADYPAIAAQYKPFDTTQLAIDAATGALFGAAFHAGKKPAPKTPPEPTLSPDEHAAALTLHEVRTRDGDTLTRPGDLLAANAAHDAQITARAQLDAGEAVSVAHLIRPEPPTVQTAMAQAFDRMFDTLRGDLVAEAANRAEPGDLARLRKDLVALESSLAEANSATALRDEAKALQKTGLSRKQAESASRKSVPERVAELQARIERVRGQIEANGTAARAEQDLALLDQGQIPDRYLTTVADASAEIIRGFNERPIAQGIRDLFVAAADRSAAEKTQGNTGHDGKADSGTERQALNPPAAPSRTAQSSEIAPEIAQATQRLAETPELIIRTEDGADIKAFDALRAADEEIARATIEAQGFQAAIACALRFGE